MAETEHQIPATRKLPVQLSWAGFVLWAVVIGVPLTVLTAKHWSTLPAVRHASENAAPDWRVCHVVVADCGCSRRLVRHLARNGRIDGVAERILLVGEDRGMETAARDAGIPLAKVSPEEAESRFGVAGGPFLLVHRPDGSLAYAGGHGPSRGKPDDWRTGEIVRSALSGNPPAPLPAFGCGASPRLSLSAKTGLSQLNDIRLLP